MRQPEYEYWGLMAQTWDLFRGDTSGWPDRSFFLDVVRREGQPVLDIGCGTGRILLDFLQMGIDIDGVDNSPEMLAICRQKAASLELAPALYQQQVQELDLPRRYRTILVPSSTLQLLVDPQDALDALRRIHDHLLPGGLLATTVMQFWRAGDPLDTGWKVTAERARAEDGATLRRWSRSVHDPANQWESTEDRYEVVVDGQVVFSELHAVSPATRWYTPAEARQLVADASFVEIRACQAYTAEPVQPEDRLFTIVARRPA